MCAGFGVLVCDLITELVLAADKLGGGEGRSGLGAAAGCCTDGTHGAPEPVHRRLPGASLGWTVKPTFRRWHRAANRAWAVGPLGLGVLRTGL